MIKLFCDSCGREIFDQNEMGNFKIQEKVISFLKHQKQDQLRTQEYIFCIDCARSIRGYFQENKKEKEEEENGGDTK